MQKKLHVVHVISNLGVGGAEGVLYQLLHHIDNSKFKHTVLYFHDGPYVEKIKKLGIKTYQVTGLLCAYDPVFMFRLFSLIKKLNPDCLHTLLWAANLLGRLIASYLQIPHVEVLHNNIDQNGVVRMAFDRLTANQRGELVVVSDGVHDSLKHYAPWLIVRSAQVIKNGIDSNQQEGEKITRESLGLTPGHFVIGSVGRFEWVKNYGLLLTAFALLYDDHRKARLVLVGQGSQEQFLRTRAYDLGIEDRVIFVVGKDAQHYYELFDCFVLTSHKEGISLALLEAMRAGVVPVVTSVDQKHDVIEHKKDGFLVSAGDPEALAKSLDGLIQSRALCRRIAVNAKKRVLSDFKIETMIQEYEKVYQKVTFDRLS
ncbi:MAG: glycosyltransferase involved in cell wall biosynthesis [Alteromonas naphthalenivorans]|jgi:glycosyltransferase involved in cell wall biosynthesis